MVSFWRRLGPGCLLVAGFGCGASLPSNSNPGHDAGPACAASGASCAASGCCQVAFESCFAQGSDELCLNAIPPAHDGGGCNGGTSSDLPGVQLAFPDQPCSYTAAEVAVGIEIAYEEVITAAVAGLRPAAGDAGGCAQADDAGLLVSYRISGAGQSYCLCDTGLCAPQSTVTTTVVGTHPRRIPWDGRNWSGPSDTGNREGAAFPPGTYTVALTASGSRVISDGGIDAGGTFSVTASRPVTITP
jgi:hypothetical protein